MIVLELASNSKMCILPLLSFMNLTGVCLSNLYAMHLNLHGAVLGQQIVKQAHVIYYSNITLNDAQLNCSTTEKELYAVVFMLEKLCSYLNRS